MKILYTSIVLLILSPCLFSQEVEEKVATHSIDFTIQPTTYIAYHPRINIGANYSFERWYVGTEIEYGDYSIIKHSLTGYRQPWTPEYKYYSFRPKILLFGKGEAARFFTGAELVFSQVQDQFNDSYYIPSEALDGDPFRILFTKAEFHRFKFAIYSINGLDFSFSKSFGMRLFFGFGYAFVNNTFTEVENARWESTDNIYDSWYDFHVNLSFYGSGGTEIDVERSAYKFYDSRHLFSVTAGLTFWITLYKIDR